MSAQVGGAAVILRRPVVVMGVSACGKSEVGQALAKRLDIPFLDGDSLHPAANVAKMASGSPLTDEDRWPWLDRIGAVLADRDTYPRGVVVPCSALRRAYRERIRTAAGPTLRFVFLDVTRDEAGRRIAARKGHFMPPSLIDSQFATLERPDGEADVVSVARLLTPAQTAEDAALLLRTPEKP